MHNITGQSFFWRLSAHCGPGSGLRTCSSSPAWPSLGTCERRRLSDARSLRTSSSACLTAPPAGRAGGVASISARGSRGEPPSRGSCRYPRPVSRLRLDGPRLCRPPDALLPRLKHLVIVDVLVVGSRFRPAWWRERSRLRSIGDGGQAGHPLASPHNSFRALRHLPLPP